MEKIFNRLKNLDAYPKINEDFFKRSLAGGVITLVSSLVVFFLFISEFRLYLYTVTQSNLLVDTSRGEKLRIDFDVTFPAIPCTILTLDAMDISGEQHFNIRHDVTKKRINAHGDVIEVKQHKLGGPKIGQPLQRHGGRLLRNETYCGSCYGAETSDDDCCNSCEDVRAAYRKKGWAVTNADLIDQCEREGFFQKVQEQVGEGCNIYGSLEVNKVAGKFHFMPVEDFQKSNVLLKELLAPQQEIHNISHHINKLTFGDYYPGAVNPLDGVEWTHQTTNGLYQYFLKVVPTVYTNVKGSTIVSNQYSVTEHFQDLESGQYRSAPGVFFFYDLSPIKVIYKEEHMAFLHFMTHICAIIGGIFTVAGIIDSSIYHGKKVMKKKA